MDEALDLSSDSILNKIGKTFSGAFEVLNKAFGVEAMSTTQTHEWNKRSKEGRASIDDNECSGRPAASKRFGKRFIPVVV